MSGCVKKHFQYLRYLVLHKWFVLVAGLKIGAPVWRLVTHDLSKFRPSEWLPYLNRFYGGPYPEFSGFSPAIKFDFDCWSASEEGVAEAFDIAWLKHQHRNPHHWQHWILREDNGDIKEMMMPYSYVLEMVADWMGAGRVITGKWDVLTWYEKNSALIQLSPPTRRQVELILSGLSGGIE